MLKSQPEGTFVQIRYQVAPTEYIGADWVLDFVEIKSRASWPHEWVVAASANERGPEFHDLVRPLPITMASLMLIEWRADKLPPEVNDDGV